MTIVRKRLLVYTGPDGPKADELFKQLCELMVAVLEKEAYTLERVVQVAIGQSKDLSLALQEDPLASSQIAGIVLANFGPKSSDFSENNTKLLKKFLFSPKNNSLGKILMFCDNLNNTEDDPLWLLKSAFSDKHNAIENIRDLFRKFSNGEDIPVNRQFVQLKANAENEQPKKEDTDDEFTVAVARIENSLAYLDASAESGSEVVFVAGPLENCLKQSPRVWSALARTIDLDTVSLVPTPMKEAIPASLETLLVYTGHESDDHTDDVAQNLDEAMKTMLQPTRFKYQHLSVEKLCGDPTNLRKTCAAIILAAENSARDFDPAAKKRLVDFFRQGGKLLFVGHTSVDREWTWFLTNILADKKLLDKVRASFEKFSHGNRAPEDWPMQVPTNLCEDVQYDKQNYAVAMVSVDGAIPVLYVSSDDAGTAAFAAARPRDLLGQRLDIWKDLLRVIDVNVLPGQDHRFTYGRMMSRIKDDLIKPLPPNLFIYCADKEQFQKFVPVVRRVLHRDTYAIYQLSPAICSTVRWAPYCRTLFLPDSNFDDATKRLMIDYVKTPTGGRVMYFLSDKQKFLDDTGPLWLLDAVIEDKKVSQDFSDRFRRFVRTNALPTNLITKPTADGKGKNDPEYYAALLRIENTVSVFYMAPDDCRSVAFVVGLPEKFDTAELQDEIWKDLLRIVDLDVTSNLPMALTSGYLYCKNQETLLKTCNFMKAVTAESTPDMLFVRVSTSDSGSPTFPIRVKESHADFDSSRFFNTLKTKYLGESIIFVPVARSLLSFAGCFEHMVDSLGIVLITKEQTSSPTNEVGKVWMSPAGTATFAFNIKIPKHSLLGQNIGFAKCLAILGALKGIKSTAACIEASKRSPYKIGLKWPDDIYYEKKIKLGGVLCNLGDKGGDSYVLSYGFGINVSNKRPTACLNDFLTDSTPLFNIEDVTASILNEFEKVLDTCQKDGTSEIAKLFDESYVHLNEEVSLMNGKKSYIVGVNFDGNLKVKLQDSAEIIIVKSDPRAELCSNSLDCLIPATT